MIRACHCTGYLTNSGGVCCLDLPRTPMVITNNTKVLRISPDELLRRRQAQVSWFVPEPPTVAEDTEV